jgi:hypothetical protein
LNGAHEHLVYSDVTLIGSKKMPQEGQTVLSTIKNVVPTVNGKNTKYVLCFATRIQAQHTWEKGKVVPVH